MLAGKRQNRIKDDDVFVCLFVFSQNFKESSKLTSLMWRDDVILRS